MTRGWIQGRRPAGPDPRRLRHRSRRRQCARPTARPALLPGREEQPAPIRRAPRTWARHYPRRRGTANPDRRGPERARAGARCDAHGRAAGPRVHRRAGAPVPVPGRRARLLVPALRRQGGEATAVPRRGRGEPSAVLSPAGRGRCALDEEHGAAARVRGRRLRPERLPSERRGPGPGVSGRSAGAASAPAARLRRTRRALRAADAARRDGPGLPRAAPSTDLTAPCR